MNVNINFNDGDIDYQVYSEASYFVSRKTILTFQLTFIGSDRSPRSADVGSVSFCAKLYLLLIQALLKGQ